MKLLAIVATLWVMIRYRPTKSNPKVRVVWLFAPIVILTSLSELGYWFVSTAAPLRFIGLFGLILVLVVAQKMLTPMPGNAKQRHRTYGALRRSLAVCLLIVLALGAIGSSRTTWSRFITKPYVVQTIEPVSNLLISHSTSSNPLTIAGDANYAANVFFISAANNKLGSINAVPLEIGSYRLASSLQTGDPSSFDNYMKDHNYDLLLFVSDGRPIWGDEWGFQVMITGVDSLHMPLLYDDGLVQVYAIE